MSVKQEEAALLYMVRVSADQEFQQWCSTHNDRAYDLPLRGRVYGALVVLSNLERGEWQFSETP
jgi:hypothetical protein